MKYMPPAKFRVLLHPRAAEFLGKAETTLEERVKIKIKLLAEHPETAGTRLKYSGGFRRLRIGDYRAIYEIDQRGKKVIILFIGHRRDVYDDFSKLL
jgi:mRNA interferase RelE/StbE